MIILGIGSNMPSSFGDRFDNINSAISYLESYNIQVIKKSSYYETPSYPNKENPKFINIVIEVLTSLPTIDLASVLIYVEKQLERKRDVKNDPRTCDIDIIDYNGQVTTFKYKDLDFMVHHTKLSLRNFVLMPLKEIIPNWKHPKTKQSIDEQISLLSNEDKKSILKVTKS